MKTKDGASSSFTRVDSRNGSESLSKERMPIFRTCNKESGGKERINSSKLISSIHHWPIARWVKNYREYLPCNWSRRKLSHHPPVKKKRVKNPSILGKKPRRKTLNPKQRDVLRIQVPRRKAGFQEKKVDSTSLANRSARRKEKDEPQSYVLPTPLQSTESTLDRAVVPVCVLRFRRWSTCCCQCVSFNKGLWLVWTGVWWDSGKVADGKGKKKQENSRDSGLLRGTKWCRRFNCQFPMFLTQKGKQVSDIKYSVNT